MRDYRIETGDSPFPLSGNRATLPIHCPCRGSYGFQHRPAATPAAGYVPFSKQSLGFRDNGYFIDRFIQFVQWAYQQVSYRALQMEVNRSYFYIAMTQQLFDGMNVNPGVGQVGREAMAEGMDLMPFCR